jgi:hypothetical protein
MNTQGDNHLTIIISNKEAITFYAKRLWPPVDCKSEPMTEFARPTALQRVFAQRASMTEVLLGNKSSPADDSKGRSHQY